MHTTAMCKSTISASILISYLPTNQFKTLFHLPDKHWFFLCVFFFSASIMLGMFEKMNYVQISIDCTTLHQREYLSKASVCASAIFACRWKYPLTDHVSINNSLKLWQIPSSTNKSSSFALNIWFWQLGFCQIQAHTCALWCLVCQLQS